MFPEPWVNDDPGAPLTPHATVREYVLFVVLADQALGDVGVAFGGVAQQALGLRLALLALK